MRSSLWFLLCLTLVGVWSAFSQPPELVVSPPVTNALTRVIRSDGTVIAGLYVGVGQDSVWLTVGGKLQKISRNEMLRLSIERKPGGGKAALTGILLVAYAGNLALLTGGVQPFAFWGVNQFTQSPFVTILEEAAFVLLGAGGGYLVDGSAESEDVFNFSQAEDEDRTEWDRLREFVGEKGRTSKVHLSFQGAWVERYLPNSTNGYSYSSLGRSGASNLNLMRKLQLSYTINPLIDAGVAVMWLGQPLSAWYTYSSQSSVSGVLEMSGHGYYAVGILKPLHSLTSRGPQLDVGVGIGVASIQLDHRVSTYSYASSSNAPALTISKLVPSGVVFVELKVFPSNYLSLGITGDYVVIPERFPGVPEINVGSRTMGTASVGFALGLHF